MEPVVGIFVTRKQAESATERLCESGLDELTLLTPSDWKKQVQDVRTEDVEHRGMGAALCGLVGCALGVAGGFEFGAVAAARLAAGADPALALALLSAAILGAGGAVAGIAAGHTLETSLCDGLPKDELFIYEDALGQGRFVVIAFTNKTLSAMAVRDVMARAGAESLDAACRGWRPGWRPVEKPSGSDGRITGAYSSLRLAFKRTFHLRHP